MQNRILPGHIYHHFKGNNYIVLDIVRCSEGNQEKMVLYQALCGECEKWVRPLSIFESKVDHKKYPNIQQEYRFEEIEL